MNTGTDTPLGKADDTILTTIVDGENVLAVNAARATVRQRRVPNTAAASPLPPHRTPRPSPPPQPPTLLPAPHGTTTILGDTGAV